MTRLKILIMFVMISFGFSLSAQTLKVNSNVNCLETVYSNKCKSKDLKVPKVQSEDIKIVYEHTEVETDRLKTETVSYPIANSYGNSSFPVTVRATSKGGAN